MSKRNDRRAAEREDRKLAFQHMRQQPPQSPTVVEAPPAVSESQLAANRANAQLSTGPLTSEGRAKSSQNALKHGLTSQTVVLACEDQIEYNRQLASYNETYNPIGAEEHRLVRSLIDCHWRLDRIIRLESAVLLKGHNEFAGKFEDEAPAHREALILAELYLKYEKSLRNLNIQEARLRRTREKDSAELLHLQTIRRREEKNAAEEALPAHPQTSAHPAKPANGFVFSTHPAAVPKPFSKAA